MHLPTVQTKIVIDLDLIQNLHCDTLIHQRRPEIRFSYWYMMRWHSLRRENLLIPSFFFLLARWVLPRPGLRLDEISAQMWGANSVESVDRMKWRYRLHLIRPCRLQLLQLVVVRHGIRKDNGIYTLLLPWLLPSTPSGGRFPERRTNSDWHMKECIPVLRMLNSPVRHWAWLRRLCNSGWCRDIHLSCRVIRRVDFPWTFYIVK